MAHGNHRYLRETFEWGTRGVNMDEPLRFIKLKDIHDDHLENIITWINDHRDYYELSTLMAMIHEREFRKLKKIKVPFKFG